MLKQHFWRGKARRCSHYKSGKKASLPFALVWYLSYKNCTYQEFSRKIVFFIQRKSNFVVEESDFGRKKILLLLCLHSRRAIVWIIVIQVFFCERASCQQASDTHTHTRRKRWIRAFARESLAKKEKRVGEEKVSPKRKMCLRRTAPKFVDMRKANIFCRFVAVIPFFVVNMCVCILEKLTWGLHNTRKKTGLQSPPPPLILLVFLLHFGWTRQ